MDPNANLQEQVMIARHLADDDYPTHELANRATRLAELVLALDEWISRAGFLPERWQRESAGHPDAEVVDEIGGF